MKTYLSVALGFGMAMAAPALAQAPMMMMKAGADPLVGTWTVSSYSQVETETKKANTPMGTHPVGYVLFTPDHHISVFITNSERVKPKPPYSDADMAAILRGIGSAYIGTYRTDGNKLIVHELTALRADNVGTDQTRLFEIAGNKLTITGLPSTNGRTGKSQATIIVAERLK